MTASHNPIEEVTSADLAEALTHVTDKGLPVDDDAAGSLLPNLRSVYARAIIPADRRSRLNALNELLPRLISRLSDPTYREAVQILFGLAPGTRRSTHTIRRRQAADLLGFNVDHFRTRIEPEVIKSLAAVVHDDLLRYRSRVKRSLESLEPTGDTPRLDPEHLTHEEELISRIWQHVYGLRAELIAYGRLEQQEGFQEQAEDHRQAALREEAALKPLFAEYRGTYGEELIKHGEAEFRVEALERLVGWSL